MKKIKFFICLLLFLLIPISIIKFADNYFSERTTNYMNQAVTLAASDIYSDASIVVASFEEQDKLIKYTYKNEEISSINIDTVLVNKLLAQVSDKISDDLKKDILNDNLNNLEIPLGQLCSKVLFANSGPKIKIKTSPMFSYTTDLFTTTKEYGINNTLFEAYILAKINVEAFIPLKKSNVSLETKIYLISTVINGDIPIYYFQGDFKNNA